MIYLTNVHKKLLLVVFLLFIVLSVQSTRFTSLFESTSIFVIRTSKKSMWVIGENKNRSIMHACQSITAKRDITEIRLLVRTLLTHYSLLSALILNNFHLAISSSTIHSRASIIQSLMAMCILCNMINVIPNVISEDTFYQSVLVCL